MDVQNPYATPYYSYQYPYPSYTGIYRNTQFQSPAQQNQNAAQNNTFQWVQGRSGAEAYPVAPGTNVILMDSLAPVIYYKSTDSSGRYLPMKTYDLVERTEQVQGPNETPSNDTSPFVKRDEIDSLVAKAVLNYLNTPAKKEA